MSLRTVALVGLLGLAAGWAMGGRFSGQSNGAGVSAPTGGPRPLGVENLPPRAPIAELRRRLERSPGAPRPSRNPFVFGQRPEVRAAPAGAAPGPAVDIAAPAPGPAPAPAPGYSLSGIAMTHAADGDRFTAILGGSFGMQFARTGDTLPGGWFVISVEETTVTLRDPAGQERTFSLP